MDQSYTYARKKLADALYALAGVGSIQERLTSAAECLLLLQEDDIPEVQKADCNAIREALMKTPLRDCAPRAVRETEAVMLARQIVDLHIAVLSAAAL